MSKLLFGTAGIPLASPFPGTVEGIKYAKQIGLDAMELAFVKQVYLNETTAPKVKTAAEETGIRLSAHAPYSLNLNAADARKRRTSQTFLHKAARIASLAGAKNIVFHPGYYLNCNPRDVLSRIVEYLQEIETILDRDRNDISLSPETTGKLSQFGSLGETLELCDKLGSACPCIDFAHLHAYTGNNNSYDEFTSILNQLGNSLGESALRNLHLHVSGIHYGHRGELKHLPLLESDFNFPELLKALVDTGAGGVVICESPNLEEDALLLKNTYLNLIADRTAL